jgi:ABC-type transport system involved in cytochrome bd biosynthesis fused ATPase/permease subunit
LGEIKSTNANEAKKLLQSDVKVAYCSQRAWILAATVKANIALAGQYSGSFKEPEHLNSGLYTFALESCKIIDDLKMWPLYDNTEIGERGISISGGQKARIALSRAVYSDADCEIFPIYFR